MNLQPNLIHIELINRSTHEGQYICESLGCNDDIYTKSSDKLTLIDAILCHDEQPLAIVGLGVLRAGPQELARMIQDRQHMHQAEADRLQALYRVVVEMSLDGWASAEDLEHRNLVADAMYRRLASEVGEQAERNYLAGLSLEQLRSMIEAMNVETVSEDIPF